MRIGIINIGDELLAGKIVNTNQFDLSRMIQPLGYSLAFGMVIGDDIKALKDALDWAKGNFQGEEKKDLIVLTGGLGPTRDDLTREAVAAYLGVKTHEDAHALEWLSTFLKKPIAEIPLGQRVQATIPMGAEALRNPVGTACGFRLSLVGLDIYAFPGVPAELKAMVALHVLPTLNPSKVLLARSVWTYGWSEGSQSQAFTKIKIAEPFRFSSLPNERGVHLSLSCLVDREESEGRTRELDAIWKNLTEAIPPEALVDIEGASLTQTVQKGLLELQATVSVAESCTGGGLAVLLTELPGSSQVFEKGFITYSNQAKSELLGVDPELLHSHGAVSEPTVLAMVQGCLARSQAHFACAITGIAGPTGGSEDKPVGTVWIGVGSPRGMLARRFQFRGNRTEVRSRSCFAALNMLRLWISEENHA